MRKYTVPLILVLALILRLCLLFIDYSWDVNNHISWAEDLYRYGFKESFFSTISTHVFGSLYPNYPPLSLYLFYVLYPLQKVVHSIVWWLNTTVPVFPSNLIFFVETKTFLAGIYKMPSIAADFGILYALILFGKKLSKTWSTSKTTYVSLLWLFNPIVFYNSAFWGQIDAIPVLFGLVSIYVLLYHKHLWISVVLFTMGLLIKPTIILYLPVYLFLLWKKSTIKQIFIGGFASYAFFYLVYLPFNSTPLEIWKPVTLYVEKVLDAQSLAYVTNSAFNFWALLFSIPGPAETEKIAGIVPYRYIGYVLWISTTAWILSVCNKQKDILRAAIFAFFFTSLTAFLFLTKMHERYVYLCIPFLILMVIIDRKQLRWYILLSISGFLNMYNSWPVPRIEVLKTMLEHMIGYRVISLLFIGSFTYMVWRFKEQKRIPR